MRASERLQAKTLAWVGMAWIGVFVSGWSSWAHADHLIFGSFRSTDNAANWAQKLRINLATEIEVVEIEVDGSTWYRVRSQDLDQAELDMLARRAQASGIQNWQQSTLGLAGNETNLVRSSPRLGATRLPPPNAVKLPAAEEVAAVATAEHVTRTPRSTPGLLRLEWDFGLQSRAFVDDGYFDQDRFEGSFSLQFDYYKSWDNDRQSFTATPFVRLDSADSHRTHGDLRELFYSRVGADWDVHVGGKRVFWGVTEFHHLIDIVNQTDLVENIDTEDKLGQPMVQLSLVRDWGILDLYALPYFRERPFPSEDGRLRLGLPILEDDAELESGAEEYHFDVAVRWSHYVGPMEFGISHFSGTSRDPILQPVATDGGLALRPYYPLIDQTAVDVQAIFGDWAFKFEGFNRSGYGSTYQAFNAGFERTIVGVLGSRTDLGVVLEYMYDDRGDLAFNTLFEHDLALGARLQFNDLQGTQALVGLIIDTDNDEKILSVEASRRIGATWSLSLEGRVFSGAATLPDNASVELFLAHDYKSAILQTEDYIQLELKKFL